MFGRSKQSKATPAPAPVEVPDEQAPNAADDAVAEARDVVLAVLDKLADEVRDRTIADVVLVLEDLVEELEAHNAAHPDDAYSAEHINGVLDAICKVRLS